MNDLELSGFLKLLTHDLQNQLGTIDLNLQILPDLITDNASAKAAAPFLNGAAIAARDLNEMLIDIQMFTQTLSETSTPAALLDLSGDVRDCAAQLARLANERQIDFQVNIEENLRVKSVTTYVCRALGILLADTLRSSLPNSVVTISCFAEITSVVEITSTQEGLFESERPNLARFLAERLLHAAGASIVCGSTSQGSCLRAVWKTGQM